MISVLTKITLNITVRQRTRNLGSLRLHLGNLIPELVDGRAHVREVTLLSKDHFCQTKPQIGWTCDASNAAFKFGVRRRANKTSSRGQNCATALKQDKTKAADHPRSSRIRQSVTFAANISFAKHRPSIVKLNTVMFPLFWNPQATYLLQALWRPGRVSKSSSRSLHQMKTAPRRWIPACGGTET
jgi:hypothetical protein